MTLEEYVRQNRSTLLDKPGVRDLLGDGLHSMLGAIFSQMSWAEDEIEKARGGKTSPDRDDPLWRAFPLMRATHDLMGVEYTFRSHVRELLGRIKRGEDTRPATDAEIILGISDVSAKFPLQGSIVGLQMRLFARALPEQFRKVEGDVTLADYEKMYGREMDDWERKLRRKAAQPWRSLDNPSPLDGELAAQLTLDDLSG